MRLKSSWLFYNSPLFNARFSWGSHGMRQRRAVIGQSVNADLLAGQQGGAAFDVHAPRLPSKPGKKKNSHRLAADPLSILTVVHWASHAGACGPGVGPEVFAVISFAFTVAFWSDRPAGGRR